MKIASFPTVSVDRRWRGAWEVVLPDRRTRVPCETLDAARQVAYRCAAHSHPCELIVHDAYHRVIQRERIDGDGA